MCTVFSPSRSLVAPLLTWSFAFSTIYINWNIVTRIICVWFFFSLLVLYRLFLVRIILFLWDRYCTAFELNVSFHRQLILMIDFYLHTTLIFFILRVDSALGFFFLFSHFQESFSFNFFILFFIFISATAFWLMQL